MTDVKFAGYAVCSWCGKRLSARLHDPDKKQPTLLICESGKHAISEDEFSKMDVQKFISEDGRFLLSFEPDRQVTDA